MNVGIATVANKAFKTPSSKRMKAKRLPDSRTWLRTSGSTTDGPASTDVRQDERATTKRHAA